MTPVASVLIPARNEEQAIEECLERVAAQDVGAASLEVIVADGRSSDRTAACAEAAASRLGFGRFAVIDNLEGGISPGLNAALGVATAPIVVRVDARSRIQPDHVQRSVDLLERRPDVGVVGGAQVPEDPGVGVVASGIARALSNRVSTGLARYRRSAVSGPADTVWLGAFRSSELRALGGWSPSLNINEDYELNERYRAAGQVVWFDADLRPGYIPRRSLNALARQYFEFGRTKGARWGRGAPLSARHVVLLVAPLVAVVGLARFRRAVGAPAAAALLVASLGALDALGGAKRPASVAVRASAAAATVAFASAWWTGAVSGWCGTRLATKRRRP